MTRPCETCGSPFDVHTRERHRRRFCSQRCQVRAYRERNGLPSKRRRSACCKMCGRQFEPEPYAVFCSAECRAMMNAGDPRQCGHCGSWFLTRKADAKFCSRACSQASRTSPFTNQAKCARRRARMFTQQCEDIDPEVVFISDEWACYLCGVSLVRGSDHRYADNYATLDHVQPLARGGTHTYDNLRACCLACNTRKGAA